MNERGVGKGKDGSTDFFPIDAPQVCELPGFPCEASVLITP